MESPDQKPWWLDGGYEVCGFCLQRYSYEMEIRCECCDGPMCPLCAQRVIEEKIVYCPHCTSTEEE